MKAAAPCWWCGFPAGEHDPRCNVPQLLAERARREAPAPSSRELFQEAQAAGTTIGHQWRREGES